jgi:hypothetical protein
MVEIDRAMDVPRAIVTAMRMQIAGEIVVKMNGPTQHCCRLRHEAPGRRRLRRGNHRSLLQERSHSRQHDSAGDPSQVWIQAQSHPNLLRDLHGPNKPFRGKAATAQEPIGAGRRPLQGWDIEGQRAAAATGECRVAA